jgi:hypothetical protein
MRPALVVVGNPFGQDPAQVFFTLPAGCRSPPLPLSSRDYSREWPERLSEGFRDHLLRAGERLALYFPKCGRWEDTYRDELGRIHTGKTRARLRGGWAGESPGAAEQFSNYRFVCAIRGNP